ncbi:Acyl-CoA-binding-like protein isoform 1 [Hibiscus syriacus]|uniref:Acyl-CoA-binding-like protein isoform 1 n=1 Tax=Hibiscus syriacus TaxID=106335 RepID=A0A6A3AME6_HIBSY|nr:Acyl-CoA-binding-like protein isoform 1 [Hibiscus syriacus]
MGIVIATSVWEPSSSVFVFISISISCFLSRYLFPFYLSKHASTKSPPFSDHPNSSSSLSLRFQLYFLCIYSLASVLEGLWSVYGEFELFYYGISKEDTVTFLLIGFGAALFVGRFLGLVSDLIFETWAVIEHDKVGSNLKDLVLSCYVYLVAKKKRGNIEHDDMENFFFPFQKGIGSPSIVASLLAIVGIICKSRDHDGTPKTMTFKDYRVSFYAYILGGRRIWLLTCAQACLPYSIAVFWIRWPPTQVADGREVYLGLIYPCMLGARMLESTVFPWLIDASFRTEDCIMYAFVTQALLLSIIAYDYQDIGVLVTQFFLFHACIGLNLPSLARLRTMYVSNGLCGGMISLSLAPANAAILFLLMQPAFIGCCLKLVKNDLGIVFSMGPMLAPSLDHLRRGYYRTIENSTMIAFAAVGLFMADGCMHVLKRSIACQDVDMRNTSKEISAGINGCQIPSQVLFNKSERVLQRILFCSASSASKYKRMQQQLKGDLMHQLASDC